MSHKLGRTPLRADSGVSDVNSGHTDRLAFVKLIQSELESLGLITPPKSEAAVSETDPGSPTGEEHGLHGKDESKVWPIGNPSFNCFDIDVVGADNEWVPQPTRDEIITAFKKAIGVEDFQNCIRVNNTTYLIQQPYLTDSVANEWLKRFRIDVHYVAAVAGVLQAKPSNDWHKITSKNKSGDFVKHWLMVEAPQIATIETGTGDLDGAIKMYLKDSSDPTTPIGAPSITESKALMVFARQSKFTIHDLLTMDCWTKPKEHPSVVELQHAIATDHVRNWYRVVPQNVPAPIILGNRVFGAPTNLALGVQRHQGHKLKFMLTTEQDVKIHSKGCNQLFFKPIQVSDFILEHLGPCDSDGCSEAAVAKLNKLLKGVKVQCAYSKRIRPQAIQAIVGKAADQLTVHEAGAEPRELSLAELFTETHGRPLRHSNLPCIDFGTEGRHFYLPAEACKIVVGQPFSHPLPITIDDEAFKVRQQKSNVDGKSKVMTANPFENVTAKGFSLRFVEVVILPQGVCNDEKSEYRLVPPGSWDHFRQEIGERFGKKFAAEVKAGRKVILPYRPGRDPLDVWKPLLEPYEGDVKTVLIACIPAGLHNHVIHQTLRRLCDIEVGIQCNIVTAKEVIKRTSPGNAPAFDDLVKYTGAIVRKIFARAGVPGYDTFVPSHFYTKSYQAEFREEIQNPKQATAGLLIGIHVQRLAECTELPKSLENAGDYYLVSVSSFNTTKDAEKPLHTTHRIIFQSEQVFGEEIGSCVKAHVLEHLPNGSTAIEHIVHFRSGCGVRDRVSFCSELENLPFMTKHNIFTNWKVATHLTYVEQATAMLADGCDPAPREDVNCVAQTVKPPRTSPSKESMQLFKYRPLLEQEDSTGPFPTGWVGVSRGLAKIFARAKSDVENSVKTYLVTCSGRVLAVNNIEGVERRTSLEDNQFQSSAHRVSALGEVFSDTAKNQLIKSGGPCLYEFKSRLQNTALPDMMFLTQAAANRALKYVTLNVDEQPAGEIMPFHLERIHPKLQYDLYFL